MILSHQQYFLETYVETPSMFTDRIMDREEMITPPCSVLDIPQQLDIFGTKASNGSNTLLLLSSRKDNSLQPFRVEMGMTTQNTQIKIQQSNIQPIQTTGEFFKKVSTRFVFGTSLLILFPYVTWTFTRKTWVYHRSMVLCITSNKM